MMQEHFENSQYKYVYLQVVYIPSAINITNNDRRLLCLLLFPTKQVHLQFNFPIKNVQFWVFQIAKIYIYVFFWEQLMHVAQGIAFT